MRLDRQVLEPQAPLGGALVEVDLVEDRLELADVGLERLAVGRDVDLHAVEGVAGVEQRGEAVDGAPHLEDQPDRLGLHVALEAGAPRQQHVVEVDEGVALAHVLPSQVARDVALRDPPQGLDVGLAELGLVGRDQHRGPVFDGPHHVVEEGRGRRPGLLGRPRGGLEEEGLLRLELVEALRARDEIHHAVEDVLPVDPVCRDDEHTGFPLSGYYPGSHVVSPVVSFQSDRWTRIQLLDHGAPPFGKSPGLRLVNGGGTGSLRA